MDTLTDVKAVAAEAFATLDTGRQIGHSLRGFLFSISTMRTV
jgi:hypothetical protein